MNIAFHTNQLSERGTEVSMYNYAKYNEELLGNKSIILSKDPSVWPYSHQGAINKFKDRFKVFFYKDIKEIDSILEENNIDVFYAQKSGRKDGIVSSKCKTVIHAVFQDNQPHGDVYAYISEWLGRKFKSPAVPYICEIEKSSGNLRKELSIPDGKIVFGRYGGRETFDIPYVKDVIKHNKDKIFLFMNTDRFTDQKNAIFLEGSVDDQKKSEFINTCDAMLHARLRGESFGLAVAEFSLHNKPVITLRGGTDQAHVDMLGDTGIYYSNKQEIENIINNFKKYEVSSPYMKFTPENVMETFEKIFLR